MDKMTKLGSGVVAGIIDFTQFIATGKKTTSSNSIFNSLQKVFKAHDRGDDMKAIEEGFLMAEKWYKNNLTAAKKNEKVSSSSASESSSSASGKDKTPADTSEANDVESLKAKIDDLKERMKEFKKEQPSTLDYYDGSHFDREAYNDAKKDWKAEYDEMAQELKDANKALAEAQKALKEQEKKAKSASGSGETGATAGSGNTSAVSGSGNTSAVSGSGNTSAVSGSGNTSAVSGSGNTNTPTNTSNQSGAMLGQTEYINDGITRAEDAFNNNVLSKNAITLNKAQQLEILQKAGLNPNNLEENTAQDGVVAFKSGNNFFRVVNDNNQIKLIHTVMNNNKASTKVYQI